MHETAYNGTAPVLIFEECTIILSIVHFLTQMHGFLLNLDTTLFKLLNLQKDLQ